MKYSNIKSKGLLGFDVSKETILKEYGFAYHVLPRKGLYRFYIGIHEALVENEFGGFDYTEWEVLELPLNVKIEEEFPFIDVNNVARYSGLPKSNWLGLEAPEKLCNAISYYGSENF